MHLVLAPQSPVKARRMARGFTLVELMAVVAIVAILAVLGTVGIRKYIRSSKTSEALVMIGAIKMAQEEYYRDTFAYKDISGVNKLDNYSTFYPATTPLKGGGKVSWGGGTDAVANGWRELGVRASGPVMFIYGCAAGPGSMAPASPGFTIGNYPTSATGQPWYLIKAVADLDGNGTVGSYVGTSLTAEIFPDKEEG
ncbi:MAG: prepilin-type N-terminal cleavage/methylation domain-containing protein [Myxococcales bacterium]|nr:MAG: prepilin-type N-terminal cleavage/methylation domain-containing protein [Myxococcales bacterium]